MDYEESLKELELIIAKLESGEVKFDEATKLFERGAQLSKDLLKNLEQVKGKVTVIRQELDELVEQDLI